MSSLCAYTCTYSCVDMNTCMHMYMCACAVKVPCSGTGTLGVTREQGGGKSEVTTSLDVGNRQKKLRSVRALSGLSVREQFT